MISIIGVAGKARSGKDTVANLLRSKIHGTYRYSFATPIKLMVEALPGMPLHQTLEDEGRKEEIIPDLGRSYRYLWQTLGTEWGRHQVHPDIWLICAGRWLAVHGPGMIVGDVRFENEADWIRSQGGCIVHVVREGCATIEGSATHQSEVGIESKYSDYTLWNTGTVGQLSGAVGDLVALFGERNVHKGSV